MYTVGEIILASFYQKTLKDYKILKYAATQLSLLYHVMLLCNKFINIRPKLQQYPSMYVNKHYMHLLYKGN